MGMVNWFGERKWLLAACGLSVIVCLTYAMVRSSLPHGWLRANGGGVPYVVFWALVAAVGWPRKEFAKEFAFRIALITTLVTCGLECFQLYNPEPLATFRRTRFGAALLGASFAWADIPPYFIGGGIGWAIIRWLGQSGNAVKHSSVTDSTS